jgi:hypothetical protein
MAAIPPPQKRGTQAILWAGRAIVNRFYKGFLHVHPTRDGSSHDAYTPAEGRKTPAFVFRTNGQHSSPAGILAGQKELRAPGESPVYSRDAAASKNKPKFPLDSAPRLVINSI